MNNQNNYNVSQIFRLPNLDFKTQTNISIDQNVHIKNVINIQANIYDTEISSLTGKCTVKGKIGLRILYIDQDNVFNTISDSISFLETISNEYITNDCQIFLHNKTVNCSVNYDNQYLQLSCLVNAKLYANINTTLNLPDINQDNLVVKKSPLKITNCIGNFSNTVADQLNFNLPQRATRILNTCLTPCLDNVKCHDGYISLTGKNVINICYEVENNSVCELKFFSQTKPFSIETQVTSCDTNCIAQLDCDIKPQSINFSTELNEQSSDINLDYEFLITGSLFKTLEVEAIEDLYSTNHELDLTFSKRQFSEISDIINLNTNIEGDIQLADDNIDEIIETINHNCQITQGYINENKMVIEGIVTSQIIYYNEEHDLKSMQIEMPFSLTKDNETAIESEIINYNLKPINCKCKIKRGNTLSLDYDVVLQYQVLIKKDSKFLDKIDLGKNYDYGDIAFQILIAKENETLWDFCKRAHTTSEKLLETNKETPPVFQGGERIVIFR